MNLESHYNNLYNNAVKSINNNTYTVDDLIDSTQDNRFGITLLARPPIEIKENIQQFINEIKPIEPHQYYYSNSDIHITIMSIISCFSGFKLENIIIKDYIDVINLCLKNITTFKITFKGITASSSGLMIQGFMENDTLNELRNNLRLKFKSSSLLQSIDERYTIQTAHSTVVRFRSKLKNKTDFLNLIQSYRNHNFGTFEITDLELVYNDWYQRAELVKKLHKFDLI